MNEELDKIQDNFAESIGQLASNLGLNRIVGQIYALLFLSNGPLSLDYIVEQLKVSKGNVSVNVRELEKWGAVRKVWVKGSRKDYYEANPDTLKVILNRFKTGLRRRLDETMEVVSKLEKKLSEIEPNLQEEEKKSAQLYNEKIQKIKVMHNLVDLVLGNIPSEISPGKIAEILSKK